MKINNSKNASKILLVLALITFALTPMYSMIINGYIWQIHYDDCSNCGACVAEAPDFIAQEDDKVYFKNGTLIGNTHFYLEYTPDINNDLVDAHYACPSCAIYCETY